MSYLHRYARRDDISQSPLRCIKMKIIITILVCSYLTLSGQINCDLAESDIGLLISQAEDKIYDESSKRAKSIRESKKLLRKGLKVGYEMLSKNEIQNRNKLIDQLIEIEVKLSNYQKAKKLAIDRIDKLYSQDSDLVIINPDHYSILSNIELSKARLKYFTHVKRKNSPPIGHDSYSEDELLNIHLSKAKILQNRYSLEYAYRYLTSSNLIIEFENETLEKAWGGIYSLILEYLFRVYSYDEILFEFENAKIQKQQMNEEELRFQNYFYGLTNSFIEFFDIKIYFRVEQVKNENGEYQFKEPTNFLELKENSILKKCIIRNNAS